MIMAFLLDFFSFVIPAKAGIKPIKWSCAQLKIDSCILWNDEYSSSNNAMIIKLISSLLLIMTALFLISCGNSQQKKVQHTYIVQQKTLNKTLYFTGNIQPIKENTITSPMEAVVETMHYHYGEQVKKDQEIFSLNSLELQKQYNETLTEYLKAKDNYTINQAKFSGTEDLWKEGLVSKNNFLSEKSSLNNYRVALMQAKHKLAEMLKKTGEGNYQDISKLSFAEFDKVRDALAGKHDLIHIKSPSNGVLLYPPKGNDDKSSRIAVGSSIKAGQVLALVGDLHGIRVEIDIPEVDIDKIKPGIDAIVRGAAFAKQQELKGKLVTVNSQASAGNAGALPSFTAFVEVNNLKASEQSWIKVGMSAAIELSVASVDKIMVPMSAIYQKNGKNMVNLKKPDGAISPQVVITGAVYDDNVVVDLGLKVGDVILYD